MAASAMLAASTMLAASLLLLPSVASLAVPASGRSAVVVGSGVGGLYTAARLARVDGLPVLAGGTDCVASDGDKLTR